MAKKSVARDKVYIDPMFLIPDGADELTHDEQSEVTRRPVNENAGFEDNDDGLFVDDSFSIDYTDTDEWGDSGWGTIDGDEFYDTPDVIPTPTIVGIVSQKTKSLAGGGEFVDVVIEVEGLDGNTQYEMRVTKI